MNRSGEEIGGKHWFCSETKETNVECVPQTKPFQG